MPHSAAAEVYISACNREHAECAMEFVNALDSNERVAALGHRAVPLSDVDLRCIAEAIRSLNGECALKVLNLEENAFGLNGVQALMEALESNPGCIRELRLGKNNLKDAAASAIGQILSRDGCGLKVLDLSENGITKHGVIPIASALQNPTCDIVELSFHNNKIDSDAAAYLGQAIRSAPKLKHLHLGYNALRDSGASQLAKSLPEAVCLSTLDLTANRIGPVGGEALVRALKKSSRTVQRLNLRHNLLDSDTILMFADVIRTNTSLIQLFLGFMNPTPEVAAEVLNALRDNRPLLLLDIYGWKLHSRNALDVIRGIQENNTTLAAIVSDGCAQIAPQIDEGNNARESKDLHPLYVGPDDRDAYLATKSLKRYSRAQSRRQSRASSTRGSRAGSTRGRTSRRASTSHRHSSRHDSRAPHDSRGERSERSGRSTSRGAHEHKDERGERREARSDREGRSERATSRGTHDHRDDRSERKEARSDREGRSERATSRGAREHKDDRSEKREARSDRETRETNRSSRHESGRNRDEPAETPASRNGKQSQPPARGEERRDTGSEEDRDIEALLRELRKTPCDPSTARVIEGLVRALQRKIDRQCGCGKQDNRGIAQTRNGFPNDGTNRQNNQFPPQGQGSSNTYGNNSNNRQNPNTYGRQPTNNNYTENNSSNPGYGRTNDAPSPYANGATSNDNSYQQQQQQRQNLYQRSVSREWERAETPLVRPNSELRDVPPDLARHNEGPGEERPEEASLQRSVYVQNFPPRIEPSPAQDANPPRRKSVSHML